MIPNSKTDHVYFSSILLDDERYSESFKRVLDCLDKYDVSWSLLEGTKDIWARDFMPVQLRVNEYVSFKYDPSYLKTKPSLRSNPKEICDTNNIDSSYSDLIVDGGNIVNWESDVIMTSRVFRENIRNHAHVLRELELKLKARVHMVDDLMEDMTGHIDGHLRFIDEKTLLVNELKKEERRWVKSFHKMIKKGGFDYVEMPWFQTKERDSAIGIYLNYLEVGRVIVFPVFEVEGNKDEEALGVIKKVFPERMIMPVNVNEIAKDGGLLNCVSWQIKK